MTDVHELNKYHRTVFIDQLVTVSDMGQNGNVCCLSEHFFR